MFDKVRESNQYSCGSISFQTHDLFLWVIGIHSKIFIEVLVPKSPIKVPAPLRDFINQ